MTVAFSRDTALQIIANEKMGFKFGVPERPDENSLAVVLPITRKTSLQRHYVTLAEAKDVKIADTGSISRMRFTNDGQANVFVRSGTILKGSTQERAITRSAILFPGKSVELECRCVHKTRGIQPNAKVEYGGITPLSFDQSNYDSGFRPYEQQVYWRNAETFTHMSVNMMSARLEKSAGPHSRRGQPERRPHTRSRSMRGMGGGFQRDSNLAALMAAQSIPQQDDLAANLDDFATSFADLLAKIKLHDNQVGFALISDKGCENVELFDVQQSWKALHDDAVKSVGANTAKTDSNGVFQYKPEKAVAAVKAVLGIGYESKVVYEHRPSNGEPHVAVVGLSNEKYTGEVVEIDGRVMHLLLLRMNKN